MSYNFDASNPQSEVTTSTGHVVFLEMVYGAAEKRGVSTIIAASGISLLAVLGLFVVMGISAYKTIRTPSVHRFMRTHVVAYFISLLICDVIASVGSLMNGQWISQGGVHLGAFCTSQGALKNTGNVGTALWSLVIAIHTFCLLVLKWRSNDYVLYGTLFVVWAFIGLVVIIGPAAVQSLTNRGPYFGVSGYWCWITDGYAVQRVTLEYFWMFLSAFLSLILYSLVFLSLRGNIIVSGGKLRVRVRRSSSKWEARTGRDSADGQAMSLAKHMLAYPIAYTALIAPIAICRFLEWANHDVPFELTIFADTVFMLSGLVNVILFATTRKIVPTTDTRAFFSRSKSSPSDIESQKSISSTATLTPFVMAEKVTVSPVEPQMAVVPVTLPVPALQAPRPERRTIPKRSASLAPTVASVYSQKSAREPTLPTLAQAPRKPQATKKSIRQSIITPLRVVKKSSLRKPNPELAVSVPKSAAGTREEDLGQRESWSDESSSRYSASSFDSTAPLRQARPMPATPHRVRHHHHSKSSSSSNSYRSPGTPF